MFVLFISNVVVRVISRKRKFFFANEAEKKTFIRVKFFVSHSCGFCIKQALRALKWLCKTDYIK